MKISRQLLVFVLSLILTLSACDDSSQRSQEFPGVTDIRVNIGNISVKVLDVLLRNSVQTHYLMSYPEPGNIFFEVVLKFVVLCVSRVPMNDMWDYPLMMTEAILTFFWAFVLVNIGMGIMMGKGLGIGLEPKKYEQRILKGLRSDSTLCP